MNRGKQSTAIFGGTVELWFFRPSAEQVEVHNPGEVLERLRLHGVSVELVDDGWLRVSGPTSFFTEANVAGFSPRHNALCAFLVGGQQP